MGSQSSGTGDGSADCSWRTATQSLWALLGGTRGGSPGIFG